MIESKKTHFIKEYYYKYNNNIYIIYIKDFDGVYSSYLQGEKCGIISLMFGLSKADTRLDYFINLVEANLEDYIISYIEDYED